MPSLAKYLLLLLTLALLSPGAPARAGELLPQAKEPYRKGMLAAQQQDYRLALRYLLAAEQADPEAPELYFYLGLASSKLPGYELRSLAWFQLYLLKVPEAPKAGAIRDQVGALEVSFESRLGKILEGLKPLLASDTSAQSLNNAFYLAYSLSYLGDLQGGLSVVRAATGKDGWEEAANQYPEVRNRLDSILTPLLMNDCSAQDTFFRDTGSSGQKLSMGDFDETQLPEYLRTLQSARDPKAALAAALADLGRLSVVYRVINGTFDPGRHPDGYWRKHYLSAYHLRGMLREMCPEYLALSIDDFSRGIEIDPQAPLGYYLRGHSYADLKDYPKAIADSSKAIELDPKYADSYGARGAAYAAQGNYRGAVEDFSKEIELDPKITAYAYLGRGAAHLNLQNYPKAFEDFNKALELDPKIAEAYLDRGRTYAKQAEYCQALQDYDKALELNPGNAEALQARDEARAEARRLAAPAEDPQDSGTPAPASAFAAEVLRHLEETNEYRDLRALYQERKGEACWATGAQAAAVRRRMAMLRTDAANPTVINSAAGRMVQYTIGGQQVKDEGIAVSQMERSPNYRGRMAEALAQNILSNPAEPNVQAALLRFRKEHPVKEPAAKIASEPEIPLEEQSEMAREVLGHLTALPDYEDLQALYDEKQTEAGWGAGDEGTAVTRRLELYLSDASKTMVVTTGSERALQYCINGFKVLDDGIAVSDLESSPAYRSTIAEAIAQNILTSPVDPKVQAALERYRAARK